MEENLHRPRFDYLEAVSVCVDEPLFPVCASSLNYHVVGVDDCLELRADPRPGAEVTNCIPKGSIVLNADPSGRA